MVITQKISIAKVALILLSAIFVCSCSRAMKADTVIEESDKIPTVTTKNHSITYSENGKRAYRFSTKLMERYDLTEKPYMEFKKGIKIETYDSLMAVKSELEADYAIYYEEDKLWEAKGNVKGQNVDGDKIFTEQIFWNEKIDSVYSNVDTKIVRGEEVSLGAGFKADGELKNIEYWRTKGRILFDTTTTKQDSLAVDSLVTK